MSVHSTGHADRTQPDLRSGSAAQRMARAWPRLLAIRGVSGSGKTTLIEALIPALSARGVRVGTIKHAHHGATLDVAGKDSHRHAAAGAACVLLLAPDQAAFFVPRDADPDPNAWRSYFDGRVDLILVEGYRRLPLPSITIEPTTSGGAQFEESLQRIVPGWTLRLPRADPGAVVVPTGLLDRIVSEVLAQFDHL